MPNLNEFLLSIDPSFIEKSEQRDLNYFDDLFIKEFSCVHVIKRDYNNFDFLIKEMSNEINLNEKEYKNFYSNNKKIIININRNFFHFIYERLGVILFLLPLYPDLEIIFTSEAFSFEDHDFISFTLKALDDYKIKYQIIFGNEKFLINNFYIYDYPSKKINKNIFLNVNFKNINFADLVYNFFKPYFKYVEKPNKKVLVSRKKVVKELEITDGKYFIRPKYFPYDKRIDNEKRLEQTFINLGYEIIYPEDFKSFEEQINYFHNVKKIVSLTGAGLTNCIFMKPQGTVIEIHTTLLVFDKKENVFEHVQDLVWCMSYFKEHIHITIPNTKKSSSNIDLYINKNKKLKELLEE